MAVGRYHKQPVRRVPDDLLRPILTEMDRVLQEQFGTGAATVNDHGDLAGLTDDDHPQYLLLAGRSGSQTARGNNSATSGNLTLLGFDNAPSGAVDSARSSQVILDTGATVRADYFYVTERATTYGTTSGFRINTGDGFVNTLNYGSLTAYGSSLGGINALAVEHDTAGVAVTTMSVLGRTASAQTAPMVQVKQGHDSASGAWLRGLNSANTLLWQIRPVGGGAQVDVLSGAGYGVTVSDVGGTGAATYVGVNGISITAPLLADARVGCTDGALTISSTNGIVFEPNTPDPSVSGINDAGKYYLTTGAGTNKVYTDTGGTGVGAWAALSAILTAADLPAHNHSSATQGGATLNPTSTVSLTIPFSVTVPDSSTVAMRVNRTSDASYYDFFAGPSFDVRNSAGRRLLVLSYNDTWWASPGPYSTAEFRLGESVSGVRAAAFTGQGAGRFDRFGIMSAYTVFSRETTIGSFPPVTGTELVKLHNPTGSPGADNVVMLRIDSARSGQSGDLTQWVVNSSTLAKITSAGNYQLESGKGAGKVLTDVAGDGVAAWQAITAAMLPTHDHSSATQGGASSLGAMGETIISGTRIRLTLPGTSNGASIDMDGAATGGLSIYYIPRAGGLFVVIEGSVAPGALFYGHSTIDGKVVTLNTGASGEILTSTGSAPQWSTNAAVVDLARTWTSLQTFRDTTFKVVDDADASKTFVLSLGGASANADLTLAWAGTADHTVTIPNATTTLAGLAVAQTFTKKQTFNCAADEMAMTLIGETGYLENLFQQEAPDGNILWAVAADPGTTMYRSQFLTMASAGVTDLGRLTDGLFNYGTFAMGTLTANRTYTFPNVTGPVPILNALPGATGRVLFASGTAGQVATDSDFSFSVDTLTITKIAATQLTGNLTFADAINVVLNATTGTKIGTATTEKLGFWNTAPVAQYATTGTTTGFTANTSANFVYNESTFTGNTGSTAYTISDIVRALKLCGIVAA